jgi:hypothetical protein
LEKTDIETAFASIMKSYKNGTSQLLKLNINNTSNHAKHGIGIGGLQTCFVFDENNNSLKFDDIRPETQMITIIEFEGIKFTSKSFQFEMNARQMLVINEKPIFNSCLIKPKKKEEQNEFNEGSDDIAKNDVDNKVKKIEESVFLSTDNGVDNGGAAVIADNAEAENGLQNEMKKSEQEQKIDENEECLGELKVVKTVEDLEIKTSQNENKKVKKENVAKKEENVAKKEENVAKKEENIVKKENVVENRDDELVEVNLELPQELDSGFEKIKLQNANEVYYKMYKEAKEKAKSAKKIAVEAYLAAEEIKFTYNLIDNESDSDDSSNEGESDSENESDNHN